MDMTTTTATPKKGVLSSSDYDWGEAAGPMQGATSWTPSENAQASTQLAKILQSDSPLMTLARSGAERAASRRGLLSSSIAAGAGQEAMVNTATPIATQDANTWAQSQRDAAQAANDFARDANSFGRQKALTSYQGILARESQTADQNFRSGEAALDRDFTTKRDEAGRAFTTSERTASQDFSAKQAGIDRDLTLQRDKEGRDFSANEAALSRAHNEAMTRLSAQLQQDAAKANIPQAMIGDMSARMSEAVRSILSDPNMDGATKDSAIQNYYKYANTQMQWMAQFYGVSTPNFMGGDNFKPATGEPAATPATPPSTAPAAPTPQTPDEPIDTRLVMGDTGRFYDSQRWRQEV